MPPLNKTDIEWADYTWNPVTGCQHNCPYCYAKGIAYRFGGRRTLTGGGRSYTQSKADGTCHVLNEPPHDHLRNRKAPYPFFFDPTFHAYRLNDLYRPRQKAGNIFVCSMADMFGPWVPDWWIEKIFDTCLDDQDDRFLFLTKSPERYNSLMQAGKLPKGDRFWYGTTIDSPKRKIWAKAGEYHTFASIEPLLEPLGTMANVMAGVGVEWFIIGAETGHRKGKVIPEKWWIEEIVNAAHKRGKPVFMKDSLIPIVGEENMLREYPEELQWQ